MGKTLCLLRKLNATTVINYLREMMKYAILQLVNIYAILNVKMILIVNYSNVKSPISIRVKIILIR